MNKPRETWPRRCKQAGLLLYLLLAPGAACADIPRWLPNPNDDPQLGDATPGERFGEALALDGDRLAVSAIEGYDSAGVRSGRVRVFRRAGSGWGPHTDVELPAGQQGARFGVGLALQGDTLVVGAPGVDRVGLLDLGAVQVYAYDGMRFQPQQLITDSNGASLYFGTTIALDGETLAISRTVHGSRPSAYVGEVAMYGRAGSAWVLQQVLRAPAPRANDAFGATLDLVGGMLIVGAPGGSPAGAVFTYTRQGRQWVLEQQLDALQGEVDRLFGYAVATDGERLLVSAPAAEPLASGAVYEYRRRPGGWDAGPRYAVTGIADLRLFGVRIARHGSRWVVGSVVGTNVSGAQRNELFVYNDFGSGLVIERQLGIDYQAGIGNAFPALAVDDQSVLAGLPTAKGATFADAGEVRVVPLLASGGSVTTLSTGVTAKDERFGTALDATADWLLVGAPGERRYSAQTGLVYAWPLADGAPATGEPDRLTVPGLPGGSELGSTLAVSGSTVLVGAPNGGGGSVHAFEHDGLVWRMTASWSPDEQQFVGFGQRLAAQADRFVVGSARTYGSGSAVLVIERIPGGWAPPMPIAPVDVLPPFESWVFGGDFALADTTIAVGAPRYFESANGTIFTPDGAVFVFARAGSDWPQVARLEHPAGIDTGAGFGQNVAMRDGWLAVSAPTGGEVHLFSRDANGAWNWRARINGRAAVQGGFGSRLGFVGDELWIAEPTTGSVYRYRRIDADWRLAQRVRSPDASPLDGFGMDFTRIGDGALIGAPMRTGHRPPIWSAGAIRLDELSLFGDGFEP